LAQRRLSPTLFICRWFVKTPAFILTGFIYRLFPETRRHSMPVLGDALCERDETVNLTPGQLRGDVLLDHLTGPRRQSWITGSICRWLSETTPRRLVQTKKATPKGWLFLLLLPSDYEGQENRVFLGDCEPIAGKVGLCVSLTVGGAGFD